MSPKAGSPELGSPSKITQYSKKTGRPIRRSAGKHKRVAGYVDSQIIEEDDEDQRDFMDNSSDLEDGERLWPQKKRKRTPSPSPPPLAPIIRDEEPQELSDDDSGIFETKLNDEPRVTLQFNIPLGFHGPLMVKLEPGMLVQALQNESGGIVRDVPPGRTKQKPAKKSRSAPGKKNKKRGKTFADLPPELRNTIYRHLFVTGESIHIGQARNLCRSGQFLSTNKLIHSEGCSVLYGENTFVLDRSKDRRGPFWEPVPKEIGYTDVRRFLTIIGPENLFYLRDIHLVLDDACPSATPYLSHEKRRYINDDHLIEVLRILRETKLRQLNISFYGRRTVLASDTRILRYLGAIKADEVMSKDGRWYQNSKIMPNVWDELKEFMTRKEKMYTKK